MKKWFILAIVSLVALLLACAPTTAPAPAPVPASAPVAAPAAPKAAPTPTAADTAWAKVIEAAKKEGTVNIYSYNLVGDIGLAVTNGFQDKYGIKVEIITGRGAEFLERLKVEKRMGRVVADVSDGSSLHMHNFKNEGFTVSLPDKVPVFSEQGVWLSNVFGIDSKDKHIVGLSLNYYSPWINTTKVTQSDMPQVWKDLLKPKWKSNMILTDPTTSGGPQQFFVPLMREKVVDEEYLKGLYKQDILFSTSLQEEGRMLARGERAMSIRGSVSTLAKYITEGAPIKAIDLKDGVVELISPTAVLISGAPHPNAARLFMDWFLSKEGHAAFTKSASAPPVRKDVPDPTPDAARITPQKPVVQTMEDIEEALKLFRGNWPNKLWGR